MSDFNKPTGVWIDEPQEVEKTVAKIGQGGKIYLDKEKEVRRVRTMYIPTTSSRISCKSGEHEWEIVNKSGEVRCKKCPKHRFLLAVFHKLENGHIVDRDTHQILD